jgi:hypothetical protein
MPPVLCAVTHIDELTPALEWAPPYDLVQADRPKALRIRDAIEHIGDILRIGCDRVVPVSVRDVDAAYNIDLLWSLVATNLGEARIATGRTGLFGSKILVTNGGGGPMACPISVARRIVTRSLDSANAMASAAPPAKKVNHEIAPERFSCRQRPELARRTVSAANPPWQATANPRKYA